MIPTPRTVLTLAILALSPFATTTLAEEGWVPLFDGKTLDGWKVNGGTASYKVEDGAIVGTTVGAISRTSCSNWKSGATPP